MTKFSPEYINYILSDEASVLQEHLPREGEGVWFIQRWVVEVGPSDWSEPHILAEDDETYILDYEDYEDMEFIVLPTLSDSLDMIEEAGYMTDVITVTELDAGPDAPLEYLVKAIPHYRSWLEVEAACGDKGDGYVSGQIESDEPESDRILAAATLAVRVLEERKE